MVTVRKNDPRILPLEHTVGSNWIRQSSFTSQECGDDLGVIRRSRRTERENTMNKIDTPARWYEREHWSYAADQHIVKTCADWMKLVPWQLFCTFTFAWKVSDPQADKTFVEFINRIEASLKCNVAYVRGDEKRFSGCGKPACGRHFHVLLASEKPLPPAVVEFFWKSMAGKRSDDAGIQAEPYDSHQNGVSYVVKSINDIHGDWSFRKLR